MMPANHPVNRRQANARAAKLRWRVKPVESDEKFVDIPHIKADAIVLQWLPSAPLFVQTRL